MNKRNFKIANTKYDRRLKLPAEEHQNIIKMYQNGEYSQRQLADMYGVSRRLIRYILAGSPKQNIDWRTYYNKNKHNEAVRNNRKYKQSILKNQDIN